MNCDEALSLLYDYVDKEVSEIDAREIKEHLDNCGHCLERYKLEESVNDLLKAKLAECCKSTPKVEELKTRILQQLDEIDNGGSAGSESKGFKLFSFGLVSAAALIVLVGAAFFGSDFTQHYFEYYSLEKAHFAVESANPPGSGDALPVMMSSLVGSLHYELKPQVDNFTLAAGFVDTVESVPANHFVYRDNGSSVSVFIFPASQFQIPEDLAESKVQRNHLDLFDHYCRGCRLVYHKTGDAVVVTATTDKNVELLDFIPGHASL
jgi:anti-sigma factor (TIGR02949 family)